MSNKPGVEIYSKEWREIVMPGIDNPIGTAAAEICRMYNLGSSLDPMIIYGMILNAVIDFGGKKLVDSLVVGEGELQD